VAITQTGSTLTFTGSYGSASTGTVSSTITVPSDAEIVIVGLSGYHGASGGFSSMFFTKGGSQTAMTKVATGMDAGVTWQGALFYQVSPDTGSNKSLTWSYTGGPTDPLRVHSVQFWKGIDTATPVRSHAGTMRTSLPIETGSMTAQSGDKALAFIGMYTAGNNSSSTTWTSPFTSYEELTNATDADAAWGVADPTASTTAKVTATQFGSEWSLGALVLIPAAGAAVVSPKLYVNRGPIRSN
jgi:hypothetical protein